jgi:hypothetical protein
MERVFHDEKDPTHLIFKIRKFPLDTARTPTHLIFKQAVEDLAHVRMEHAVGHTMGICRDRGCRARLGGPRHLILVAAAVRLAVAGDVAVVRIARVAL